MDDPEAYVTRDDQGNWILVDPIAAAIMGVVDDHNRSIAKQNCKCTFNLNEDRINHFRKRIVDLGYRPDEMVIVVIHADDVHGQYLAEALMPNHDWQPIRDQGLQPYARGMAEKKGIIGFIRAIKENCVADRLEQMKDVAVVVVDHGTCQVFS